MCFPKKRANLSLLRLALPRCSGVQEKRGTAAVSPYGVSRGCPIGTDTAGAFAKGQKPKGGEAALQRRAAYAEAKTPAKAEEEGLFGEDRK